METNLQEGYSYVPYQNVDTDTINIRAVVFKYLRNWYWFLLSIGILIAAAYIYLRYQPPSYKSKASVLIKDEKKGIDQESVLKELEIFAPKKVVENEIEILKSYTLMDRVARQLNLSAVYFRDTPYGKREIYKQSPIQLIVEESGGTVTGSDFLTIQFHSNQTVTLNDQTYRVNTGVNTPYGRLRIVANKPISDNLPTLYVQLLDPVNVANNMLKNLKAEPTSKSSTVIVLSVETPVADKGEAILNRLISVYNEAAVMDKNQVAANTLHFIEERLKLISGELATVERGVENYKSSQGITDLSTQAQGFLETVQQNDAQLNQVNIQLGALHDLETYLKRQPGSRAGAPATVGLNDPTLLGLIEEMTKLEGQRDQLARTTSEENPLLVTIESQIRATKANITENVATMKNMLVTAQKNYVGNNNKMERVIKTLPAKERALMDITRQQAIKNDLYTYLLKKREETAVSFASTISDSRTVDAARSELRPVKPNKQTVYMLFALIGLFLPIAGIAASDALNNRIMRRTDVESNTHVPILGEVVKKRQPGALVVALNNQSIIAEQIRTLRTNLQYLRDSREGSQVLLFTSSISGEGKSFVSLNLGASLALAGRRVVILEMDLRKPRLRHSLGDLPVGNGLSNYLIGEISVDEVVKPVPGCDNYFIITSGPLPPNPSELLSGPRLETLIAELRQRFDYIIIDAPPVGLVTDAQLIAPYSDATMFMIRHDVTPKSYLKMIESLYVEKRFNKLNIVLNAVGDGEEQYYSYGYGYKGKGYSYGEHEQKGMFGKLFSR
ncbi:GumC family protein [Fibrella aquatilis]|uniref:non-specific protein-tyrosine kinase n=1 Tax=Fibrella aquatilis TaxID=2817059 RepID=A0A939G8Z5_9BACT|nr:tyrosine-protein kinase [Fibrella aquatilis]MBO0933185.1 polysaccharide biosynthesis tyrosine autokinase [Fibrella aquatilis]